MVANITIGDDYALLDPHVPEAVKKHLTYWAKEFIQDPQTGRKKVSGRTVSVYSCEELSFNQETGMLGSRLVTLPGFAGKIADILADEGYEVNWIDRRTTPPKPDLHAAVKGLRDYQIDSGVDPILSGGGICTCPTGYGKTYLMAAVINAYSREDLQARGTPLVVVVTPGKDLAKKNYRSLCEILPAGRDVGLISSDAKRPSEDVQVVTPESMHHVPMEYAGIVIYDEVHTLSAPRAESVMRAKRALRFGFSATPDGRFDGADVVVEGVFGPIVHRKTFRQAVEERAISPVRVVWLTAPAPGNWRDFSTRDARYRHGLWRNARFHQDINQLLTSVIPADWQTITIADKLEHLNSLAAHIPDTVQFAHGTSSGAELTKKKFHNLSPVKRKDRERIYEELESGELLRAAATGIYRVGVDFPELRVIVNVAGMGSKIIAGQLPGRTSRLSDSKEYGYIVDFWHPWDQTTRDGMNYKPGGILKDDMKREQVYSDLGFEQAHFSSLEDVEW